MNQIEQALSRVGWWDWWEPRYGAVRHRLACRLQRRIARFCWWMGGRKYGRGVPETTRWHDAARALSRRVR